ncbi:putative xyloglucan endotransglucosylase/hydrolase protein 26 [Sesamum angolense]|uniref:Xyloglucan endotransglucosylase/hydrolase protein 26 n=1 Tax=Sesamum angolense TaxID=2727404 RepID=A0AAE1WE69_9LAMI|nr:putative xyloglucan endotransglucosylase/hydrolase protein 26 [Sesamum angolense]
MANIHAFCLLVFFVSLLSGLVDANIFNSMLLQWGAQHSGFIGTGDDATLVLDHITGSGIESKKSFLFGSFEMQKLVPGNSAGTPYMEHDTVFPPMTSLTWNGKAFWWYVDSIPIRVFRNYLRDGIPYPNKQAMRVYSSIWNADSWATRGGQDKIDWTKAPFVARLRRFTPRACKYNGPVSVRRCSAATPGNWWSSPANRKLSSVQQRKMDSTRNKHMIRLLQKFQIIQRADAGRMSEAAVLIS